jgi:hypothetical protein
MCVCELEWSDKEWADILVENKLPADTPKPKQLQDTIEQDDWSSGKFMDLSELPLAEQLRKFVLVDGNHRIWILQSIKVGARDRDRYIYREREREQCLSL